MISHYRRIVISAKRMGGFRPCREILKLRIMRIHHCLPIAVFSFVALLNARKTAETVEQKLQWVRETIDTHAVTHHFEPPAKSSNTKWQVTKIEGCAIELKETTHRESPDSIYSTEGAFGLSEDRVVTWSFDLANLLPGSIAADEIGGPHLIISGEGDMFHFKSDVVSRTLRKDGTTLKTSTWSSPGTAQNFWIYFDSPGADNSMLVKNLVLDLQNASYQCSLKARSADHHKW
jgi:hypothetical protein